MNHTRIKKAYTDIRSGNTVVNPVIQFVNFIMLFYLVIDNYISIYIFIPLFLFTLLFGLLFIGNKFRHIQYGTDLKLQYDKNFEQAKTLRIILEAVQSSVLHSTPLHDKIKDRIEYLKVIESNG